MSEYIERQKALDTVFRSHSVEAAHRFLAAIPAADVRPVVLCRDCVHFQQFRPHDGFCKIDGMLWNNDFFCAAGEKREES